MMVRRLPSSGGAVQNFGYSYDVLGRLTTRSDANTVLSESFTYDALSRLATAQVGVDIAKSFSYNNIGNILIKSDVGNYTYPEPGQPFPHAVSSISGSVVNATFTYDANGNQTGGNGLMLTYAVQGIRLETHSIGAGHNVACHSKAVA